MGDEPIGVIIHAYMKIPQGNSLYDYFYLKQAKMLFFFLSFLTYLSNFFFFCKIREQEAEQVLSRGKVWHQWEGGGSGKKEKEGEYGAKTVYTCV
jgi:hypothetical protein